MDGNKEHRLSSGSISDFRDSIFDTESMPSKSKRWGRSYGYLLYLLRQKGYRIGKQQSLES